jgi:aspartyl aminopeptidase
VQSLLKSNPKYTTVVIGFDKEEVGSMGSGGAKGKFFERVIYEILFRYTRKKPEDITVAVLDDIYKNSIAINADVDVGSTDKEIESIDARNTAKLGYGMFVAGTDGIMDSDQQSPKLVDRIMSVLERRKVIFHTIGSPVPADNIDSVATMNEFFINRGIPTINCGAAVGSLHSPEEISHVGDLYFTIKGYQAMIEDPRYVVRKKRRKKK